MSKLFFNLLIVIAFCVPLNSHASDISAGGSTEVSTETVVDAIAPALTDTSSVDLSSSGGSTISAAVLPAGIDHGAVGGLSDDDHSQYFKVTGRSNENLTLSGTAKLLVTDGAESTPGIAFSGDTNTGLWREAGDTVYLVAGGHGGFAVRTADSYFFVPLYFATDNTYDIGQTSSARPRDVHIGRHLAVAGNLSVSGSFGFANGTVSAPSISFTGDPNTGFFTAASDRISVSSGGSEYFTFNTDAVFSERSNYNAGALYTLPGGGGSGDAARTGGNLFRSATETSTSSTTETTLVTHTLSGVFQTAYTANPFISYEFAGTVSVSGSNHQFKVKYGGTTIFDSGALVLTGATSFRISGKLMQTTTNAQRAITTLDVDATTPIRITKYGTAAINSSGGDLILTGQVATGGGADLTHKFSTVNYY